MSDQEQERLKRLRDRQLADRDPLVKGRQFHQSSTLKEKRAKKPFSISKAWAELPHIVKAPFYGLILGIIVMVVLPYFWDTEWTFLASLGATVLFVLFGVVTGNALDVRENIKDNLK